MKEDTMSEKYLETLELLRKASTDKGACTIDESAEMNDVDVIRTPVPAVNLALNSNLDGGLTSGLTFIAGPSRHFKSNLGLLLVASYLRKYDDATCVFIDTEFGTTPEYLASMGVDPKRTLHIKCESVEKIRSEMAKQLKAIRDYDNARKKDQPRKRVIFFVDSIGNSASSKEVSDAENENSAADMTRAKVLKSLFRVVTPYFKILDIPCVAINHTYQTIEMFSKTVMGGGCVVAGTKVQMADGTLKSIEDIVAGESVRTLTGSEIVTDTWNPDTLVEGTPECFELEFEDGTTLICSENHKILVMVDDVPTWVVASNLATGMEIIAV
ncbi:DNA repair protein [Vibrio phage EniLVp02]